MAEPEILFRSRKFEIRRVLVRGHDGCERPREYARTRDAVVVLALTDSGEVVLIRNLRPAIGRPLYELPAGTLEEGEDACAGARRELEEETGFQAAEVRHLGGFFTSPGLLTERLEAFVATRLTAVGQHLEPTEFIEVEVMPLDRVRSLAAAGGIEDAKSLAALFLYELKGRTTGPVTT